MKQARQRGQAPAAALHARRPRAARASTRSAALYHPLAAYKNAGAARDRPARARCGDGGLLDGVPRHLGRARGTTASSARSSRTRSRAARATRDRATDERMRGGPRSGGTRSAGAARVLRRTSRSAGSSARSGSRTTAGRNGTGTASDALRDRRRRPSRLRRSRPGTRDVFCEAGAGTGKTRVLVGPLLRRRLRPDGRRASTRSSRSPSPSGRPAELRQRIAPSERGCAPPGASSRAWLRTRATRSVPGSPPSTGSAAGSSGAPGRRRARSALPRHRRAGGRAPARARGERGRSSACVADGDERVARVAAAYRPWRLGEIALLAHERLRSQGMAEPEPAGGRGARSARTREDDSPLTPGRARGRARTPARRSSACSRSSQRRYEELKPARSGLDFADLELRAVERARALGRRVGGLARSLPAPDGRRVPGHEPGPARADRPRSGARTPACSRSATSTSRSTGSATPTSRCSAPSAASRERDPAHRGAAPPRELPLAPAGPRRGERRSATTLLEGFPPLTAGRETAADDPRVELLLTLKEGGGADHVSGRTTGSELRMPPSEAIPATVAQARALAERLRELVDAGEVAPGDIVVLLRAFTHVDAYEEALRRFGLEPYVVGGRGYWSQQQVEDLLRLLGGRRQPARRRDAVRRAREPGRAESARTRSGCCAMAAGERRHVWPALERGFGGRRRATSSWRTRAARRDRGRTTPTGCARFCATIAGLRAEAAADCRSTPWSSGR